MDEFDRRAFAVLFAAVVEKSFGHPLNGLLSESDSRHLSHQIEEGTGLVIGWRSIKNYAAFLHHSASGKPENPSVATLDTMARYVLGAPATTEAERKMNEAHFPYWFRFREQVVPVNRTEPTKRKPVLLLIGFVFLLISLAGLRLFFRAPALETVTDNFHAVDEPSLRQQGWFLQAPNTPYWSRRGEKAGRLTLFTLKGDNWQKTGETPRIQNLLLRPVDSDCFRTEVHFTDFIPTANWQQAGLVLLEDTSFSQKSIRLSLSYNDFFGGYVRPGEILIQAIASYGKKDSHLEEFVHQPLFQFDQATDRRILTNNLKNFAFRVEKQGKKLRILYSASPVDNFSFKEITTYEFDIKPNYVGLFALKGFVDSTAVIPVAVRFFQLENQPCD